MSKTTLKKELSAMDAPQLREMIMDVYDARKEAKEYFEFFLDPDVDKLFERRLAAFNKELSRSKWGRSKARVSTLKKIVADFVSFRPGAEHVRDFMVSSLKSLMIHEKYLTYTETQERYAARLILDIMKLSEAHGFFDSSLAMVQQLLEGDDGRMVFRRFLSGELQKALSAINQA